MVSKSFFSNSKDSFKHGFGEFESHVWLLKVAFLCNLGQKLCKFGKKIIAAGALDDYYSRFGCKD